MRNLTTDSQLNTSMRRLTAEELRHVSGGIHVTNNGGTGQGGTGVGGSGAGGAGGFLNFGIGGQGGGNGSGGPGQVNVFSVWRPV